jgi:hypothetical protein
LDRSPEWVRAQVVEYYLANPVGNGPHDAFCAWWLTRRWGVEPLRATAQALGGNHDWGLDGFYIEQRVQGDPPVLHLIQAKFSSSVQEVKSAVGGFVRTITQVASLLNGGGIKSVEANPTLERLHAALCRLRDEQGIPLEMLLLRFEIIHLCDTGKEELDRAVQLARGKFDKAMDDELTAFEVNLRQVYPPDELLDDDEGRKPKKHAFPIRFAGELISDSSEARFFAGFGYLADLVKIYGQLGDPMFSKNVRAFLIKSENKGPAMHMRESLDRACVPKNGSLRDSSERFAMLHNGVTIAASQATPADGNLLLYDPNVVNGCQTVKNAWKWHFEQSQKQKGGKLDEDAWLNVRIPVRVLVTKDEALVRDVTISNNRQNAIKPSAFRVNDRMQLALAERFKKEACVFYERQEASFLNLKRSYPRVVEDEYSNSFDRPIEMEELAMAIATASLRPALSVAAKPSELFESPQYDAVFSERTLSDLELLLFLRNLRAVMPLALKDLRANDGGLKGMSPGRYSFPCMRVLARYIVRDKPNEVQQFGAHVIGSFGVEHPMRKRVRQLMSHHNSGLHQQLKRHWSDGTAEGWVSASDVKAVSAALSEHGLLQFDVFKEYRSLQDAAD